MLKKLYLLQTYLIIIQCSNEKTISINDRVNQEVSPFVKLLDDFKNAQNEKAGELKGRIIGKLEGCFKRIIIAENKADELLKKEGKLENKIEFFSKTLGLLGVRSRLETLVDDLYPEGRPFHISVAKTFEEILTSQLPKFTNRSCIKVFRERVSNYGISVESFVDAIRSIYGSFSEKVAHKISEFVPRPSLYDDKKGIEEMLINFGMTADDAKVRTIQIILQPLPMSD